MTGKNCDMEIRSFEMKQTKLFSYSQYPCEEETTIPPLREKILNNRAINQKNPKDDAHIFES